MNNYSNNNQQGNYQGANENMQPVQPAQNSLATQQPVSPEGKVKKPKKKKLLIWSIIILLVAALGVTAYFVVPMMFGEKAPDEITLADLKPEEITTLEFYPTSDCSKSDLEKVVKVMTARLEILGKAYEISCDDEKINLRIGKFMLGETAIERASTLELIQSRGNFGIGSYYGYVYTDAEDSTIKEVEIVTLKKATFVSDYKSNFDEDFYNIIDGIDAEDIYVVSAKLTSSAEDEVEEWAEYDDDQMYAIHDVETYSNEGVVLGGAFAVESEDYAKSYIVSKGCSYAKNADLIKHIVENDGFDIGFVSKIVDEPTWETDKSKFGKKQVTSMSGETIIVEATPDDYTVSYTTELEYETQKNIIKSRLDVLGVDYMFGTKGFDDKIFCIRIAPKNISPDLIRMIFNGRDIEVRSTFDYVSAFSTYGFELDETGNYGLIVEAYNTADELRADYNIPNDIVYLVVNDVTVAQANINDIVAVDEYNNVLKFEYFTCFDNNVATSSDKKILEMICAISEDDFVSYTCEYEVRLFNGDNEDKEFDLASDITWKHSSVSEADLAMFNTITSMGYNVIKKIDTLNMIEITIDVPVDANLVSNFAEKAKEIYNNCYFDGGAYRKIIFVIKDEKKNSPANEFRIVAEKNDYYGKMLVSYEVGGPDFSDYWLESYEYEENDEFFVLRTYGY